jgi:hypothetical protein
MSLNNNVIYTHGRLHTTNALMFARTAVDPSFDDASLPTVVEPAMRQAEYLENTIEGGACDALIAWLVNVAETPVSDYALECACRNDWWKTTLPILLASKHIVSSEEVFLNYAVLHPDQLAVLPRQFREMADRTLRLRPFSWIYTAARLCGDEVCADARRVLQSMLCDMNDKKTFPSGWMNDDRRISLSAMRVWDTRIEPCPASTVDWMSSVLQPAIGISVTY